MGIIGRRKRMFLELVNQLRTIEQDLDNLSAVKNLNLSILNLCIKTEKDIIRHKASLKNVKTALRTGRGDKSVTRLIRSRIKGTQAYITRYTAQLWLWKLFGDALAYSYLDKFSIKHAYFSVEDFEVKQDAGMLDGKLGLANELHVFLVALEHQVPAILCDITNILRHGDVCLLGESDPYVIEVKTSKRLNQRGGRQKAALDRLHDFLSTNRAAGFRGAPGQTIRQTLSAAEITYVDQLNRCIKSAKETGFCAISPEPGLCYIASYGGQPELPETFTKKLGLVLMFSWNDAKNLSEWAPYVPFLLTIRDPQHLIDFIEGALIINIMVDADCLAEQMSINGWRAHFHEDSTYAVQCVHEETGGVMCLSAQFISRIGYECCSAQWVAKSQIEAMSDAMHGMAHQYGPFQLSFPSDEWQRKVGVNYQQLTEKLKTI